MKNILVKADSVVQSLMLYLNGTRLEGQLSFVDKVMTGSRCDKPTNPLSRFERGEFTVRFVLEPFIML